ncbi:MAG: porin, partial [Planctomycetota bacterium]
MGPAIAAACLIAFAMRGAAQEPLLVEEIPAPAAVVEGLQNDIQRLEKEIEALRTEKGGETFADQLATFEKGLSKLVDANDKKKKEDAKKPSLILSGQVQADQIYFGQDAVSRTAVGDLQDGAQFRRLRIGARGTSFDVLEYSLGVDFALANQPSYLDNYIEWKELPWLQNIRVGHYFEPFSLERVTQNRNNTFMERSLVDTF